MEIFYKTFIDTINPENDYTILTKEGVIISIIIHVVGYLTLYKYIVSLFNINDRLIDSFSLTISLFITMILGYIGRLYRSKSIYNYYIKKGFSKKISKKFAMKQINNAYFTWYFLA